MGTALTTVPSDPIIDAIIKDLVKPADVQGRAALSKSAFKRLRSKLLFKRINFWLDDYVEKTVDPAGAATDVMLMGSSIDGAFDLCEIHHYIRGICNIQTLGIKEEELMKSVLFNGQIHDLEYDKEASAMIIHVRDMEVKEIRHDH